METRIWHPLCLNTNLGAAPLAITLLGEDLVLWRDASGSPVLTGALEPTQAARDTAHMSCTQVASVQPWSLMQVAKLRMSA